MTVVIRSYLHERKLRHEACDNHEGRLNSCWRNQLGVGNIFRLNEPKYVAYRVCFRLTQMSVVAQNISVHQVRYSRQRFNPSITSSLLTRNKTYPLISLPFSTSSKNRKSRRNVVKTTMAAATKVVEHLVYFKVGS